MSIKLPCRGGCAACCIEVSISSPIPGMPGGKPAGIPCVQLDEELRCRLFGRPERPAVCRQLQPEARATLRTMEWKTAPLGCWSGGKPSLERHGLLGDVAPSVVQPEQT
jgi:hypothetical protein